MTHVTAVNLARKVSVRRELWPLSVFFSNEPEGRNQRDSNTGHSYLRNRYLRAELDNLLERKAQTQGPSHSKFKCVCFGTKCEQSPNFREVFFCTHRHTHSRSLARPHVTKQQGNPRHRRSFSLSQTFDCHSSSSTGRRRRSEDDAKRNKRPTLPLFSHRWL